MPGSGSAAICRSSPCIAARSLMCRVMPWSARPIALGSWTAGSTCCTRRISDGRCRSVCRKPFAKLHHGELLVGAAEVVETDNPDLPFLIAAPTMRVPTISARQCQPISRRAGGASAGHARHIHARHLRRGARGRLYRDGGLSRSRHRSGTDRSQHVCASGAGGDGERPAGAGSVSHLVGGRAAPASGTLHRPNSRLATGVEISRTSSPKLILSLCPPTFFHPTHIPLRLPCARQCPPMPSKPRR